MSSKGFYAAPTHGDHCTREGAQALANKLDAWWHAQGYPIVQHWIEPAVVARKQPHTSTGISRHVVWTVKSNLVRGQPPRSEAPQ